MHMGKRKARFPYWLSGWEVGFQLSNRKTHARISISAEPKPSCWF